MNNFDLLLSNKQGGMRKSTLMTKTNVKTLQFRDLNIWLFSWSVLSRVYAHPGWLNGTDYASWLLRGLRVVNGRRVVRICAVPRILSRN